MADQNRVVANSDNKNLMPVGNSRFLVGFVDRVNGRGAEEISGFTPTRNELIQLVKYWHEVLLDNRYLHFLYGQTGSREIRENPFAQVRTSRLEKVLGRQNSARNRAGDHNTLRAERCSLNRLKTAVSVSGTYSNTWRRNREEKHHE